MLAFFLHVRYNSHVKYFEVFEIYFINSDIRKYFMEIRNLITFTKVAETQSLSKAAKALGYAQSTVTMQMQQLEQELGTQLYERVGKQIRITQTGQEFLSYAGAIVRMSEEALMVGRQKDAAVSGSLRLGILSPLSPAVGSAIARYLQSYPQVDLEVQTVQNPDDLLSRLRHNEIDLALTLDTLYTDADLLHALEDQPVPVHYYTNKAHPLTSHAGPGRRRCFPLSDHPHQLLQFQGERFCFQAAVYCGSGISAFHCSQRESTKWFLCYCSGSGSDCAESSALSKSGPAELRMRHSITLAADALPPEQMAHRSHEGLAF